MDDLRARSLRAARANAAFVALFALVSQCATPLRAQDAGDARPGLEDSAADVTIDDIVSDGSAVPERPTYTEHVRPILSAACVQCHAEGELAPMALDRYERVAPLAPVIARAVQARTMPPYPVDNSGACNTFRAVRTLSDDEIATLVRWSERGAPEGDRSIPAPPLSPPERLSGAVYELAAREAYTPNATMSDDYRCFIVDAPIASGPYFVTGFDVQPDQRREVHHVIVYHPQNDAAATDARALDERDPGLGYACFGAAGVTASAVAAWAPGGGATHYPTGTGVQLQGGRPLILQLHYNTAAGVTPDRTRVLLEVQTEGVAPGRFIPMVDMALSLPARQREATAGTTLRLADRTMIRTPLRVFGVFPHMHTLGRTLRLDVLRSDGSRQCIVDVPRWDFHWQRLYFHGRPIRLDPTETLEIRCTFDTSSRDAPTVWGEGTADEMCVAGIFVSL